MKVINTLPKTYLIPLRDVEETRAVALVTSAPAWRAVHDKLQPANCLANRGVRSHHHKLGLDISSGFEGEVVYSVGAD